jgi:hypothetical protein
MAMTIGLGNNITSIDHMVVTLTNRWRLSIYSIDHMVVIITNKLRTSITSII